MREFGFAKTAKEATEQLSDKHRQWLQSYTDGVNQYMESNSLPFEFGLVGFSPPKWTIADSMISALVMVTIGLSDTQLGAQKMIIEAILSDKVSISNLQAIFAPHLDHLDSAKVELLKRVEVRPTTLPADIKFGGLIPTTGQAGSNAWVVSGKKSASGRPIQSNDPHLELARLPSIWHQIMLTFPSPESGKKQSIFGIAMPGLPIITMGRNRDLAFGFTYGFADQFDYFIDQVKGGKYRVDNNDVDGILSKEWHPLKERREVIHRKSGEDIVVYFYETRNGVVETKETIYEPTQLNGMFLSRASALRVKPIAEDMLSMLELSLQSSVDKAMPFAQRTPASTNWLLSDVHGNIGFQQGGHVPRRSTPKSALLPMEGWVNDNVWQEGLLEPEHYVSVLVGNHHHPHPHPHRHRLAHLHPQNPPEGILASANGDVEDLLNLGSDKDRQRRNKLPLTIGLSMGPLREERIVSLLKSVPKLSVEDMKRFQNDIRYPDSLRVAYLNIVEHVLEDRRTTSPAAAALHDWDGNTDVDSQGMLVFEAYRHAVLELVFGGHIFGREAWDHIFSKTNIIENFGYRFDRQLLDDNNDGYDSRRIDVFTNPLEKQQLCEQALHSVLVWTH